MQQIGTVVQGYGRTLPRMGHCFEMIEVSAIERRAATTRPSTPGGWGAARA